MHTDDIGGRDGFIATHGEDDRRGISLSAWVSCFGDVLGEVADRSSSALMHFVCRDGEQASVFDTWGVGYCTYGLARALGREPLQIQWVGFYLREGSMLVFHEVGGFPEGVPMLPARLPAQWPEPRCAAPDFGARGELPWLPFEEFAHLGAAEQASDAVKAFPLVAFGEFCGLICVADSDARRIGQLGLLPTLAALCVPLAAAVYTRQQVLAHELQWVAAAGMEPLRSSLQPHTSAAALPTNPMFPDLVGQSAPFLHALALAQRWAVGRAPVLITGETGTGKELLARAIHALSERRNGPWVAVNCPAIPRELAESELFGHEKGAFTGATETRQGRFERAEGGVLFLDEVGDLPHAIQAKLLRVLQEGEIERVGSARSRKVDVRVIAATNRDLQDAVRTGDFRQDLYHRLAALPIHLPPLRDRVGDIELLAWHFLRKSCERYLKHVESISPAAMERLRAYDWPGNVRELEYMIERAVLLARGPSVGLEDLSELAPDPNVRCHTLHAQLRAEKRRRVENTLRQTLGNCAEAARLLGMSRGNFSRLLRALRVDPNKFRLE